MGHIDHGKSTLLDYIRKTKVVETEAGGITQHLSAYEVAHTLPDKTTRRITFLDTPGHEAFQHLRNRGSSVADIAILVVAADDGVKPQTLEALRAIKEAGIPFVVAITKIDKQNANIERAKASLLEHGVYLEGLGGNISFVPVSSKTGEGIPTLLDLVFLAIDIESPMGDPSLPAEGLVIESHCDTKRGISAVLIVKNGSMHAGEYVVAGTAFAPLRIMEDFTGKAVREVSFSSPVTVVGFSETPPVGAPFCVVPQKKEAVALVEKNTQSANAVCELSEEEFADGCVCIPIILKADVVGSLEALKHELKKKESEKIHFKILHEGVGVIGEADVKRARGDMRTIIIGFHVSVDQLARELAERLGIEVAVFSIIYELAEWLPNAIQTRTPKVVGEKELARARVVKCFGSTNKTQTLGCRVEHGTLALKQRVRVIHNEETIGYGVVSSIKSGKSEVSSCNEGSECGLVLDLRDEYTVRPQDTLLAFTIGELHE
jgi:translation initiation factor IF-2